MTEESVGAMCTIKWKDTQETHLNYQVVQYEDI